MNEKKRGGPRKNSGRKTKPEHEKSLKKMIVFTPEHWALVKDAPTRIVREALVLYFKEQKIANMQDAVFKPAEKIPFQGTTLTTDE